MNVQLIAVFVLLHPLFMGVQDSNASGHFLEQSLANVEMKDLTLDEAVDYLRKRGLPVCAEVEVRREESGRARENRIRASNETMSIRSLLDRLVRAYPDYTWRLAKNGRLINIFPTASALQWAVKVPKGERLSIGELFEALRPQMEKHNIEVLPRIHRGVPVPVEREFVSRTVEFDDGEMTFMDLLNEVVSQYFGMYWAANLRRYRSIDFILFELHSRAHFFAPWYE